MHRFYGSIWLPGQGYALFFPQDAQPKYQHSKPKAVTQKTAFQPCADKYTQSKCE